MQFSLIVAFDKNHAIGKDGKLPWHIPIDLKHFKKHTLNKIVVMGYKTWESLPIRPLPNRFNIVLTKNHSFTNKNVPRGTFEIQNYLEKGSVPRGTLIFPQEETIHTLSEQHLDNSIFHKRKEEYEKGTVPRGTFLYQSKTFKDVINTCYSFFFNSEIMVIGGENIFSQFLPIAQCIYATEIDTNIENADCYFPPINTNKWYIRNYISKYHKETKICFQEYKRNCF